MSFEIRLAGVEDIPAIRAMADVVFRRTYRDILSAEQMEYMMDMMYSEESLRRQMGPECNMFFLAEGPGCPAAGGPLAGPAAGPAAELQARPGGVEPHAGPAAELQARPGAGQPSPAAEEPLAGPAAGRQATLVAAEEPLAGPAAGRHEGLGYASVRPDGFMPDGRPRWHLEKLYVMPDAQRTGLGRALFERALAAARAAAASSAASASSTACSASAEGAADGSSAASAQGVAAGDRSCTPGNTAGNTAGDTPGNTPGGTSGNTPGGRSGNASGGLRLELNVNRDNPALGFYEHLGMRRDRQGDFPIGAGFYMNDYIMALDIK